MIKKMGLQSNYLKSYSFKTKHITAWLSNNQVVLNEFQIDCKCDNKVEKRYKYILK